MGYIGEITRQGNVPFSEPMEWPQTESTPERTEKQETIAVPERELEPAR